jgi:hypothetical protein
MKRKYHLGHVAGAAAFGTVVGITSLLPVVNMERTFEPSTNMSTFVTDDKEWEVIPGDSNGNGRVDQFIMAPIDTYGNIPNYHTLVIAHDKDENGSVEWVGLRDIDNEELISSQDSIPYRAPTTERYNDARKLANGVQEIINKR